ncbi:putative CDP-diacylglycerol--inositol 3-phosphatidyltransferase protein [Naja naja]|nr:putative CDP-diacylglycerol--inositol 3-phosphatidyltransferase protein [Naja naja]
MKARVDYMEHGLEKTNVMCEAELVQITDLEAQIKEFQLRFRGIPEQPGEDITTSFFFFSFQPVLFIMCASNELFYCMLYLCFGEGPEILSVYTRLYRLILWVCTPIAITKSFISLIHLVLALCNMATLDAAERAKKM